MGNKNFSWPLTPMRTPAQIIKLIRLALCGDKRALFKLAHCPPVGGCSLRKKSACVPSTLKTIKSMRALSGCIFV
jgi:hypothetical protein